MNAVYNCRTYYVKDNKMLGYMMRDLAYDGAHVQKTREFINTRLVFPEINKSNYGISFSQMMYVTQLMKAIEAEDENMINEVYDSKYYTFLKSELESVRNQFKNDCAATRRAVFQFPATHCFDSIQVLLRDGDVIVTVNMRSCNAYKNLMCDIFLAQRLAHKAVEGWVNVWSNMHLVMNIGSLHIFEEDTKYVL